jgi:hypothetical protein
MAWKRPDIELDTVGSVAFAVLNGREACAILANVRSASQGTVVLPHREGEQTRRDRTDAFASIYVSQRLRCSVNQVVVLGSIQDNRDQCVLRSWCFVCGEVHCRINRSPNGAFRSSSTEIN